MHNIFQQLHRFRKTNQFKNSIVSEFLKLVNYYFKQKLCF